MTRYELRIDGREYVVEVESVGPSDASVVVNGVRYAVGITRRPAAPAAAWPPATPLVVAPPPPTRAPARPAALAAGTGGAVQAPLPGLVLDVPVSLGDRVAIGDVIVRMEAMKMENDLKTSVAGVVKEIHTKTGDEVQLGQVLVVVSPES